MMKRIFTLALLMAGSAVALQAQNTLTVKGQIKGIESGRLYLLAATAENRVDTLGTALFKAPDFELKGTLTEPIVARIVVEKYEGGFTFMAEPGTVYEALLANDDSFYIRGGKLQDAWTDYNRLSSEKQQELKLMQERYKELRGAGKYRSASALNDSIKMFSEQMGRETNEFLAAHDDLIAAHTYQAYAQQNEAGLEASRALYDKLGPGAKNTPSARIMKARIDRMEKTAMGRPAPDFTLPDLQGNPVTMSKVPGKIKLLDFWASWCGPCRLNNPSLKKAYEQYHSKGFEVIGISLDDKKQRWADAVEKEGLPWINVSALKGWKCEVARMYNVTGIPAIFVLDENNRIIATDLRGEKLFHFLEEKLK